MATMNGLKNVTACCGGCGGALSSYEWQGSSAPLGVVRGPKFRAANQIEFAIDWVLMRCGGCGQGGLAAVRSKAGHRFPEGALKLESFAYEVNAAAVLPASVPDGITAEFREAEKCQSAGAMRAAAGMYRSVLDKTLRSNGYKVKPGTNLEQQIDMAAADGVLTESRRRRAHEEIRVLGNDVLHDEWHEIPDEDVLLAAHYAQRILEDFYDDRASVLTLLRGANRVPEEDRVPGSAPAVALP